ncbi:MAG: hypothetical protein V5A62_03595 [Haloarculaceae archaeon]
MATRRRDAQDTDREGVDDVDGPDQPAELLDSALVRNTDGPDRRTVFPRGLSSVARMSTWLTANEEAFVDVEGNR